MKHSFNKIALALVASAFSTSILAADAQVPTAAEIVDNLSITAGNSLDFGEIVSVSAARDIVVAPDEGASFTVEGDAGFTYSVDPEASVLTNTTGTGAETMAIEDLVVEGNEDLSGGTDTLLVGATLKVAANQVKGVARWMLP